MTRSVEVAPREMANYRGAVVALVSGSLVSALLQTMVIQIQGELPQLLEASRETTAWIVTITILVACALSPVTSRLGDLVGRTRVIITLLLAMTVGSLLCALGPNVWWVITGRGIQGLAIGVVPLAMSIMKQIVPAIRLGGAIALTSGTIGIGSALGVPLGALIAETLDWRGIFWVCFGMGLASALWILRSVPQIRPEDGGSFDAWGATGLVLGATAILVALAQGFSWGWTSAAIFGTLAGGLILLGLTIIHLLRTADPILDVRATTSRPILFTNLCAALLNFGMMGTFVIFPQFLSLPATSSAGLGIDPVAASLIMMASGTTIAAFTPITSRLNLHFGPVRLLRLGCTIVATSLLAVILVPWSGPLVLGVNIALGTGFSLAFASAPQIIMANAPEDQTAAANGFNAQLRYLGMAAASAVIASVLAHWIDISGIPTSSGFIIAIAVCLITAVTAVGCAVLVPQQS